MLTSSRAILDIEASGLGPTSYPIEVGLAMLENEAAWSALIRPDEDWLDDEWDDIAAELHGVTLTELNERGEAADQVAKKLWALLDGCTFYSDAPFEDTRWLERLRQCVWPPPPPIPLRHVAELLPPSVASKFIAGAI